LTEFQPNAAVLPVAKDGFCQAVIEGGGQLADPARADVIVWTDPHGPEALRAALAESPARWIQLPLAGIERFVALGVIDPARVWTSAKGIYGYACAEHALALMLTAARRIHTHVLHRTWEPAPIGSRHRLFKGSTVLVVGTGGIGRALVQLLMGLDVRVLAASRSGTPVDGAELTLTTDRLPELVPEADFIVLAAALTPRTKHLFGREMLARMRPTAWLINVARGGLIDADALVDALRERRIGGAALDVTEPEPLPADHPLWSLEDAIITPHVANTLDMSLPELRALVRRNIRHFARGESLEGVVDPALGY
jgi:phosphoglycerate dehydrogenase-like enzyme